MLRPVLFRRQLAARILKAVQIVGGSALASASCTGGYGGLAGTGGVAGMTLGTGSTTASHAASTSAASTSASSSGTGGAPGAGGSAASAGGDNGAGGSLGYPECFPWTSGPCPAPGAQVTLNDLNANCDTSGWGASQVYDAAPSSTPDSCCYRVERAVCGSVGRPFLVDEEARVASAVFGLEARGWQLAEMRPRVADLSDEERAALAAAWTADALLEHASVASFSRLSLALMAAGAPSQLVEDTHRAASDEVRHAKLCFSLASAYAGHLVGPGAFPLDGTVKVPTTLAEIAVSAVLEGCIGETVAAVVASEQLARATDSSVRAALAEIADDEGRHAELAWRIVAWAVETGGPPVRRAAARPLFDAIGGSRLAATQVAGPSSERAPSASREAHGRLDAATTSKVAKAAISEIVAPAAWSLFHEPDVSELGGCAG